MNMQWQGAWESVIHHPLFGIGITLGAYQLVLAAYEKTRWIFLQPVLASMLLVIGVLLSCGLSYAEYRKSTDILSILLGPATVALAVPLYLNLRRIRQLFWRSEEHTSELQSRCEISYAVFCLKKTFF